MKMIVSLCVCVCVCGWIGEWELLYYGENPLTLRVVVVTVGYQLSIVWTIGVGVTVYKFPAKQFHTLLFLVCVLGKLTALWASLPASRPLWSSPKYLNNYRMDRHEIFSKHPRSPEEDAI